MLERSIMEVLAGNKETREDLCRGRTSAYTTAVLALAYPCAVGIPRTKKPSSAFYLLLSSLPPPPSSVSTKALLTALTELTAVSCYVTGCCASAGRAFTGPKDLGAIGIKRQPPEDPPSFSFSLPQTL